MAQTVNLRLSRADNSPWGFRLQGGKDFGQPLLIQKVNGGSLAERAGLQVGDALISVNNVEVADMRHKDAQDTIVRAGNSMEITVQRGGGSTWKPHVSPVGTVPLPGKASPATTVTKTSLAAGRSPAPAIGAGHNLSPKPFGASPQVNGDPSVKAIVNKQYNTPVQMYSEETIAETLSAQAEVLAGGAIGVNFMKNERTYDSQKSEVFKMVQEVDKEPREPEQQDSGPAVGPGFGLRHVQPPEPKPAPPSPQPQQLPPGQNICADCERLIVGVFVRIKDKNLHVECFKCATCGTSLKNVGYYTINNKLYCDIHAKLVARQNPPAPNLEPVTVAPGARAPSGAFSSPQMSAAPQSPQPGTLAPLPFHAPRTTTSHVVAPRFGRQTSAPSGPKPFGSVTAPSVTASVPFNTPPSSAPISNIPAPPAPSSLSKPLPESRTPVVWPPTTQSHFLKAEEASYVQVAEKRLSICSEEVSSIASSKLEISNSILEEDRPMSPLPDRPVCLDRVEKSLIEAGERVKRRSVSPKPPPSPRSRSPRPASPRPMTPRHFKPETPDLLDVSSKPHEVHSLLPPACVVRPMTPKQVVVFPPELPNVIYSRSPTPRKEKKSPDRCTTCPSPLNSVVPYKSKEDVTHSEHKQTKEKSHVTHAIKKSEVSRKETKHAKEHKVEKESLKKQELSKTSTHHGRDTTMECSKKTVETKTHEDKMFFTKSEVEKLIHEEVLKALALKEEKQSTCMEKMTKKEESEQVKEVSVHDLPKPTAPSGWMTSALTTASERPFTPVPFPKPMELPSISEKIIPMVPMEIKKDDKPVPLPSETVPYFPPPPPPPDQEGMDERTARALREVGCRSPMTEALTVAPERPYSPLPSSTEAKPSSKPESSFKPIAGPKKPMTMTSALTVAPSVPFTVPGKTPIPSETSVKVESDGTSAFKPVHPKPFVAQQKTEKYGIDMAKVATQGHTKQTVQSFETGKITKTVHESSAEKHLLPYYQENIGEIPVRNRAISPVPHLIVAPSIKPTVPYIPQPPKPKQETHLSRKEAFYQSSKSNMQSDKVEYCQTKTVPPRPTTPSGLHPPEELPYYQKDIGVIPLRNKSVSPVPHPIKAPQLEMHTSTQQQQQLQQGYKSTVYSETKTFSAQQSSSKMLTTDITKTKETAISGRKSPQVWKLETKRTVQNLSPITVRLQSPRPVTPVQGETEQAANAKVQIHRPRPSSPLPPTVKVKVDYPSVPSSGPVIGSGNSAFTSVKNGSSTLSKKSEQLSCGQKQSCEQSSNAQRQACQKSISQKQTGEQSSVQKQTCERSSIQKQTGEQSSSAQMQIHEQVSSAQEQVCKKSSGPHKATCSGASTDCNQVCEKKLCMKNGDMQHKLSQSQETIQSKSHTAASSSTKSEMRQQSSTMQKSSHSGITSFRAYGETSKKTMSDEEFGGSGKHELQLQKARMSKTFVEQQQGEIMHTTTKARTDQKLPGGSQTMSKQVTGQKYEGAKIEHKHGETISANTLSKTNLLLKKPAIGDNKTSVGLSPCPLPTFPSLPQLSDVPWTPGAGGAGGRTATFAGSSAPKRGRGILNPSVGPGARIPLCGHCNMQIRGPFITALGKIWCPEHFVCVNAKCRRPLQDIGFVEEPAGLYCEYCFEQYLAPTCDKCHSKIKGDCLNAIGKHFHPECFSCAYCGKLFGNSPFFLEDALPYCEADWNELFTTKCFSCGFPIEAGDRWVEALNNNYHSQCFNCTMCKKNLEGQSFFAKAGRPFCKNHAR